MTIRIHTPELSQHEGYSQLSARVSGDSLPDGAPDRIDYRVNTDSGLQLTELSDPFLVSMLHPGMSLGVPLEISGRVSATLAYGLQAYQDIVAAWFPDLFRKVEIAIEHLEPRKNEIRPDRFASCFSGGIDSFNALMELRAPLNRYPEFDVTHAVMINGFDQIQDFEQSGASRKLHDIYTEIMGRWGLGFAMIHTNQGRVRGSVLDKHRLIKSFGAPLMACMHAVAPGFGRFSLSGHSSGYRYEELKPKGAHPMADHLLSTDQLQIIFTGARISRAEKLELMLDEPGVRESLRVCFQEPEFHPETGRILNCGACEKCVRTIILLDIIGELGKFPSFARLDSMAVYANPTLITGIPETYVLDMARAARRHGRKDWLKVLHASQVIRQKLKYTHPDQVR